jgi:hypothetical protein
VVLVADAEPDDVEAERLGSSSPHPAITTAPAAPTAPRSARRLIDLPVSLHKSPLLVSIMRNAFRLA